MEVPRRRADLVRARAPLRLGLAGGGTDVSPYADLHGGAVMNATIDRYIYASVALTTDERVEIESHDLGQRASLAASFPLPVDGRLDLPKAVYNRVVRDYFGGRAMGMRISTYSEAPAGSGLGSSSTLVVAVLQAMTELFRLPLGEYDVAHLAYVIEREDLKLAGGRQDQYAATFGGFNFIEFHAGEKVIVNPLRIKSEIVCELESQTLLCFTGVSRESATIIAEQARNVQAGAAKPIEAMHRLKSAAVAMKEALLKGDLAGVAQTLDAGWTSKRDMASGISSGPIEDALATARAAGAVAGKVSGAGGGGFIMFLVPLERRRPVLSALTEKGYRTETVRYVPQGATAWWT
ncbi:GHMP family kinase ATP-binding protein [Falsiroseomonas oryzae]|uniref:GHMP family kinase ATP-binding protein n=1 Tax=Falsiroseomonas oryzae TaxID=2766473 RepID=UPI0022EAAF32|nr:GHMP kinase [Roseomonas sp. MO-31]